MKFCILLCSPLLVAFSILSAQSARQRLDSALATATTTDGPGIAMLIVKEGQVVWRGARGRANIANGTALTTETPIYIASIAKQFTASAIMRLAERGRLSFDDRLVKYIPELSLFAGDVTLRQILTHTSGLPDHNAAMKDSLPNWSNTEVLDFLRRQGRLEFQPGTSVSYSNSGYVLLALVVERITADSFARYLSSEFFVPLGMANTGVIERSTAPPAAMALAYRSVANVWVPSLYEERTYGAGGLYSTVEDLLKWDQAMAAHKIVSDSILRIAERPAILSNGRPTAYGFGWLAEWDADGPLANVWYVASFGSLRGYEGVLKRIDDRKFSLIILTNSGKLPQGLVRLAHELFAR